MRIDWVRLATTDVMSTDAYREFCWGTRLPEVPAGYALLLGCDTIGGQLVTAVFADVEYARLLTQIEGVTVPGEKIIALLPDWPNLAPAASSVWSRGCPPPLAAWLRGGGAAVRPGNRTCD